MKRTSVVPAWPASLAGIIALVLGLALIPAGCATTGGGDRERTRVDQRRLSYEELREREHRTAFDVVQSLRPLWIRQRGQLSVTNPAAGEVSVYLDGTRLGGADSLHQVPAGQVSSMQYLNATEATTRFGTGHAGGAILVVTLRGDSRRAP